MVLERPAKKASCTAQAVRATNVDFFCCPPILFGDDDGTGLGRVDLSPVQLTIARTAFPRSLEQTLVVICDEAHVTEQRFRVMRYSCVVRGAWKDTRDLAILSVRYGQ